MIIVIHQTCEDDFDHFGSLSLWISLHNLTKDDKYVKNSPVWRGKAGLTTQKPRVKVWADIKKKKQELRARAERNFFDERLLWAMGTRVSYPTRSSNHLCQLHSQQIYRTRTKFVYGQYNSKPKGEQQVQSVYHLQ